MKKTLVLMSLILSVSGCAYMSQDVAIKPLLMEESSNVGAGKVIGLKISDEREDKDIGRRTNVYNMGAMITNNQDLEEVFKEQMTTGLQNKGFEITPASNPEKALKIEIRSIKYTTSMGIIRGGFLANASLKAIATNGTETYEKMYRASVDKKKFLIPFADANEAQINAAISEAMKKLFSDKELFEFLAK